MSMYRYPSQTIDEFDSFLTKFEHLIDTIYNFDPHLIVLLGDFNDKLSSWYIDDSDIYEGRKIDEITSLYRLSQIVSEPTHIL